MALLTRSICQDTKVRHFARRIEEVAVPNVPGVSSAKRFYPIISLREIFSNDEVQSILNHRCDECKKHLSGDNAASLDRSSADKIMRSDAALSLFALLICLGYPLLIGCFLTFYGRSIREPRLYSQSDLRDTVFKFLPERLREEVTMWFQQWKWQFSPPSFEDGSYQLYQQGTILPYLKEAKIGPGGFSDVYRVDIHPSYSFARKEFRSHDTIAFIKERTNLQRIAELKSQHLVQIQKTYLLEDKFNILFPLAKTNLYKYLRESVWRAPCPANISKNPLWEQVLGITIALKKIIHFIDPREPGKVLFGYHLDLKGENILVDSSTTSADILKITDFGQTEFLDPSLQTTNATPGFGGTEAYAPPEYTLHRPDSVYDIWSLGIIVLEILAYAAMGTRGLVDREVGLDWVRYTITGSQGDSRFYIGRGESAQIKPAIVRWMAELEEMQDATNRRFVKQVLELIRRMLEPRRRNRITIDELVSEMTTIFNVTPSEVPEISIESLGLEADEVVLLTSLAPDRRQDMQLSLPFRHVVEPPTGAFAMSFSALEKDHPVALDRGSISVNDRAAVRLLQMALTGHTVSKTTYSLEEGFELKRRKSMSLKVKGLFSHGPDESVKPPRALWLELWVEEHTKLPNPDIPNGAASPDPGRRINREPDLGKKTPLGRVVVYCEDRIFIVPFAPEWRIKSEEDIKRRGQRELILHPMDKSQRDVFNVSEILGNNNTHPAIPMSHDSLRRVEKCTRFSCEEMKLKFQNANGPEHGQETNYYELDADGLPGHALTQHMLTKLPPFLRGSSYLICY
ncbi:hypothetical protein UA08_06715 [Talaromyces atroroseus]|uniref:Protein kinase domain-containing protein n=1 Tax=Talaromyces atroroseus TaxID=1441469 RepID=A0A225AWK4_TALAT|nr:hypothetical protein UA08_06715 [Talaromyces atroroseus]OKL57877.1 hypothetical protein UA08_06715 [Talaromyces atroroseus]